MTIISSDTETGFSFSAGFQTLYIKAGVAISTGGTSVTGPSNQFNQDLVENFGGLFGQTGINESGPAFTVDNYFGAVISGQNFGVVLFGAGGLVNNAGTINGDTGLLSAGGALSLINTGLIQSFSEAIEVDSGVNQMTNAGNIVSSQDGIVFEDAATLTLDNSGLISATADCLKAFSATGAVRIVNSGTLRGTSDLQGTGKDTIRNTGQITGDLLLGSGSNLVTNSGSIVGTISLGSGNNVFNGRGGTVNGTITGGVGSDKIIAGNDGEILAGGGGHDTMAGGTGADTFAFSSFQPGDSDIIHQFNVTEDTIQLDHTAFTKLAADQTPVFATGAAATSAADHLFYNPTTGGLFYDVDGSGSAGVPRVIATLDTGLHLTASNFTVV